MSSDRPRLSLEQTVEIIKKGKQINQARELAYRRFQLQEQEFEVLCQEKTTPPESIEAGRTKTVSLYEQYVDSCLALRTFNHSSLDAIDDVLKDH